MRAGAAPDGSYRYYGAFFGSVPRVLAANCVWLLVIFGWTFGMMAPFFYILKLCGLLRITPEEEEVRGKLGGSADGAGESKAFWGHKTLRSTPSWIISIEYVVLCTWC
jgi:hypothetical protein